MNVIKNCRWCCGRPVFFFFEEDINAKIYSYVYENTSSLSPNKLNSLFAMFMLCQKSFSNLFVLFDINNKLQISGQLQTLSKNCYARRKRESEIVYVCMWKLYASIIMQQDVYTHTLRSRKDQKKKYYTNNQNRKNSEISCQTQAAIGLLLFCCWSFWSCLIQFKIQTMQWVRLPHISFSWVISMLDFFFHLLSAHDTSIWLSSLFSLHVISFLGCWLIFFLPLDVLNHDCITNQMRCLCNWPKSFIWFSIVLQIKIARYFTMVAP